MATGYTKLAQFIGDQQYAIIRKFQHLAARDLLYLQAELVQLEIEYSDAAQLGRECDDERKFYDREWWHLSNSKRRGFKGEQWDLALKIRAKLPEYYQSAEQYSRVTAVPRPKKSDLDLLHTWILSPDLGGGCRLLGKDLSGADRLSVYEDVYQDDLMHLIGNRGENDILTRLLPGPVLKAFHYFVGRFLKKPKPLDEESPPTQPCGPSGLHHYSNQHVLTVVDAIGAVVSSLAPLVAVISLSFVTHMQARLGLVCVFTIIFSATLAVATKARRIEIFAATAAFASVLVVFVGSTNSTRV